MSPGQIQRLAELETHGIDIWNMDGSGADIMVGPDQMSRLESVVLTEFNSTLQTVHSDMSVAVAESDNVTQSLVTLRGRPQIELGKFNSHKNGSRAILIIVFVCL